jgi:IclR family acetate operon transcriptional repressor
MRNVLVALAVLEAVAERSPVGVSELARTLQLPKTTVQRSLRTLAQAGWIAAFEDAGQSRWVTTGKPAHLFALTSQPDKLQIRATPAMRELARHTSETIHLTVRDGPWMVLLHKIDSTQQVRTVSWIGGRSPVFASSSGLATLAALPDDEVVAIIGDTVEKLTERSLGSVEEVLAELRTVRRQGYAVNPGMWRSDIAAVGAAILDGAQRPIGALSISVPANRLPPDLWEPYGDLLRLAVRQIGLTDST